MAGNTSEPTIKRYITKEWKILNNDLQQLLQPQTWPKILSHVSIVFLGCLVIAATLNFFVIPSHFGDGGFTGIAVLLKYMSNINLDDVVIWLNIPLVIIGIPFLGYRLIFHTSLGVGILSFALALTKPLTLATAWHVHDPWVSVLFGGTLMGLGVGIVLHIGGNTGGSDLVALIVKHFTGIPLNWTLLAFDASVLSCTLYYLGIKNFLHTLTYMFVYTLVIKMVLENFDSARIITIISPQTHSIIKKIHASKLPISATLLEGQGSYTHQKQDILYTVVPTSGLAALRTLVEREDPSAFMVIENAYKTFGRKFLSLEDSSQDLPLNNPSPQPSRVRKV
ncbi:YitT family protein [Pasteuria penetrans]|uniref:YitT family protein n=1 Tax=Pasteuria penetrans TaxID=86005 RepID=UPI000FA14964|nr:YitT family protein [Pasteuria penetrans]